MRLKFYLLLAILCSPAFSQAQCNLSNYTSAFAIPPASFPYFSASSGVTVSAVTANLTTLGNVSYTCGGNTFACSNPAWWPNQSNSTINLSFSTPVTSFTVIINGTNQNEILTFTPNTGTVTLSNFCNTYFAVTGGGNQLIDNGAPATGTIITVNHATGMNSCLIQHNGVGSGSRLSVLDCFTTTVTLPASLSDFAARFNTANGQTALNWKTTSENNCSGFEVQHSPDGISWASIGWVDGQGNSASPTDYSFLHPSPVSGDNFYRLRQVNAAGEFNFSSVEQVNVKDAAQVISVFPNPASGFVEVTAPGYEGSLTLTDVAGKALWNSAFDQALTVDVSAFSKGIYFFELRTSGERRFSRRIVLK